MPLAGVVEASSVRYNPAKTRLARYLAHEMPAPDRT